MSSMEVPGLVKDFQKEFGKIQEAWKCQIFGMYATS